MDNPAVTAGPANDGSKSLAKESKVGAMVQFLLTTLGTGILAWLTQLDTSHWTGWWSMVAVAAVSTAAGLVSSYLKKNR